MSAQYGYRGTPGRQFAPAAHRLSVAPMTECTDRHCRYMLRLLAPDALLYTGLIQAAALLRGAEGVLQFDAAEHPLALQLGGGATAELVAAGVLAESCGFDQINLSADAMDALAPDGPRRMAERVAAVRARVRREVTLKVRIGQGSLPQADTYTEQDYERLWQLVTAAALAGCRTFVIHARKHVVDRPATAGWQAPPLRHDVAVRLKGDFPELSIIANGGIGTVAEASALLAQVDGVMIGRGAYHDPWGLARLQQAFGADPRWRPPALGAVLEKLADYAARQVRGGCRLQAITRHFRGLFADQPRVPLWRQFYRHLDTAL